ncbi:uncharacterized protein B0H18DRAFT_1125336 [Fomitopsis serialis]|uniref:uncharacterized protein n=1 Tax=Fomitopsis serialis TaxID=139415 RepID=UPI002008BBD7|nr:uncharacterized protein B0H18DRAFT_1125336 [Neoantrodia serialis]KAH9914752.1 hypothetical protein B0H18DRAFT_1125336 [Neoantrodia serialis]
MDALRVAGHLSATPRNASSMLVRLLGTGTPATVSPNDVLKGAKAVCAPPKKGKTASLPAFRRLAAGSIIQPASNLALATGFGFFKWDAH